MIFDPTDDEQMQYNLYDRTLQFELDRIKIDLKLSELR